MPSESLLRRAAMSRAERFFEDDFELAMCHLPLSHRHLSRNINYVTFDHIYTQRAPPCMRKLHARQPLCSAAAEVILVYAGKRNVDGGCTWVCGIIPAYAGNTTVFANVNVDTTNGGSSAPPNLARRDLRKGLPNFLWLTDITEFGLPLGKAYPSLVVDCFDGAWSCGQCLKSPDAALANSMPEDACGRLRPGERAVIHGDRGCHHEWSGWVSICERHGLVRPMSAEGMLPGQLGDGGILRQTTERALPWKGLGGRHTREGRL